MHYSFFLIIIINAGFSRVLQLDNVNHDVPIINLRKKKFSLEISTNQSLNNCL
jgi:hypothetical protein